MFPFPSLLPKYYLANRLSGFFCKVAYSLIFLISYVKSFKEDVGHLNIHLEFKKLILIKKPEEA